LVVFYNRTYVIFYIIFYNWYFDALLMGGCPIRETLRTDYGEYLAFS